MWSSEAPPGGPPEFPTFPLPPGNNGAAQSRSYLAETGVQGVAAQYPSESPIFLQEAHTRREEYANEAVQATAEHWIHEQAQREKMRQTARMETDVMFGEATGREAEECEGSLEFVTGPPKFVGRIILLLAVGLFGAIPLMSPFALTVFSDGVYCDICGGFCRLPSRLHYSDHRHKRIIWIVAVLSNLHASISSVGPLCMLLSLLGLLLMAAMAAFLHFHWMQVFFRS
ncbi:hypothetical protein C3747_135g2 [Trypanosoma cruzi]|uniref:Transmembrane protein n=1 Tax=Trypanosoma cruzi TaxID=5693 RepID=A0A2V2WAG0_TRYCR|nr:hypothetical protein C3747_135g2 [Trypanosoma cruzi]